MLSPVGHTTRVLLASSRSRAAFRRPMSTAPPPPGGKKSVWDTWFVTEAIPIYVVVVAAVGGAGWYLTKLARGPDVMWERKKKV